MTYEKKSVIELREIAKERKIKGISTLKKKELIEVLETMIRNNQNKRKNRRYNVNQNNLIQSIKKESITRKNFQRI